MKKSGEIWSTNYLELHVSLDALKSTFGENIFKPLGGAAPWIFLHALEIDQVLPAQTPTGTGVTPKKFNCENLKFGLK